MVLTDPPVHAVDIEMTYKHNFWPSLMIKARRRVKSQAGPLTIGMALDSACSKLGDTYLHEPPMPTNNYNSSDAYMPSSAINDVILQKVQEEHGGSFVLDLANTQFVFENPRIVVPSTEEITEMEANRAESVLELTPGHQK